jgi:hypothetical protein
VDVLTGVFAILGIITFGVVFLCLGLLLLGEYRAAFFRNPRAVMTLEVFSRVGEIPGPGYLSMLLLIVGVVLILTGTAGLVTLIGVYVMDVFSLIGKQ